MTENLTVKQMGEHWNISSRMVTIYCKEGRIHGAKKATFDYAKQH